MQQAGIDPPDCISEISKALNPSSRQSSFPGSVLGERWERGALSCCPIAFVLFKCQRTVAFRGDSASMSGGTPLLSWEAWEQDSGTDPQCRSPHLRAGNSILQGNHGEAEREK